MNGNRVAHSLEQRDLTQAIRRGGILLAIAANSRAVEWCKVFQRVQARFERSRKHRRHGNRCAFIAASSVLIDMCV